MEKLHKIIILLSASLRENLDLVKDQFVCFCRNSLLNTSYIKKDHPFWLLKFTVDLIFNDTFKKINIVALIFNSSMLLLQIVYIYKSPNRKELFINQGPTIGILSSVMIEMLLLLKYKKAMKDGLEELYSISWPLRSTYWERIVKKFSSLRNITIIFGIILGIIALLSPLMSDISLIKEIFEKHGSLVHAIYGLTVLFQSFVVVLSCGLFIYCILMVTIQMLIVNYYVTDSLESLDAKADNYHQKIERKVKIGIRQHSVITSFIRTKLSEAWAAIQIHVYHAFIFNTSMVFFMINSFKSDNEWQICLYAICINIANFLGTYYLIMVFEFIPNTTGEFFFTTSQLSWYKWNVQNRRTLHILMQNCIKPISADLVGLGSLDSRTTLQYVKMIYSVSAVLYHFNKK